MKIFATPWVRTQTGGTTKSIPVMPDAASRIINNSKRPVIAVGAALNDLGDDLVDRVIKFHEKGIPVAATAHSVGFFEKKGVRDVYEVGIVELTNILTDPEWEGVDGNGLPDLVIVIGIHLDLTNQTISRTSPRLASADISCKMQTILFPTYQMRYGFRIWTNSLRR